MITRKAPRKPPPDGSPDRKYPLREAPQTDPYKKPQVEPPRPWPREPQRR